MRNAEFQVKSEIRNPQSEIEGEGSMPKIIQGDLSGKGLKIGIVAARFNDFITSRLVEGALDGLQRHGVAENDIDIVKVPGSYEIPLAAQMLAQSRKYQAVIC